MTSLPYPDDSPGLAHLTEAPASAATALQVILEFQTATEAAEGLLLLKRSAIALGADDACFTSYLHNETGVRRYSNLLVCESGWSHEYLREDRYAHDPWLRHAMHDGDIVLGSRLTLRSREEQAFVDAARSCGFVSTLIIPSVRPAGELAFGVLCLGSKRPGFFEGEGYGPASLLARCLSVEMHAWVLRQEREERFEDVRLTEAEVDLLRHEAAGRGSKAIAAELGVTSTTIDCRFQRICAKLNVPTRRSAMNVARSHGLL